MPSTNKNAESVSGRSKATPAHTLARVRNNQRRHRERRRQHIASLEQRVEEAESLLEKARAEIATLRDELAKSATGPAAQKVSTESDDAHVQSEVLDSASSEEDPSSSRCSSDATGLSQKLDCSTSNGSDLLSTSEENTILCSRAASIISQQNFRGLDMHAIESLLSGGFRAAKTQGEGCRVVNKLLFEVLDFINS